MIKERGLAMQSTPKYTVIATTFWCFSCWVTPCKQDHKVGITIACLISCLVCVHSNLIDLACFECVLGKTEQGSLSSKTLLHIACIYLVPCLVPCWQWLLLKSTRSAGVTSGWALSNLDTSNRETNKVNSWPESIENKVATTQLSWDFWFLAFCYNVWKPEEISNRNQNSGKFWNSGCSDIPMCAPEIGMA